MLLQLMMSGGNWALFIDAHLHRRSDVAAFNFVLARRSCMVGKFYDAISLSGSNQDYAEGNTDLMSAIIINRPYILSTLTECFASVWGRLLESVVQQACD
jgi:hypothetical protein